MVEARSAVEVDARAGVARHPGRSVLVVVVAGARSSSPHPHRLGLSCLGLRIRLLQVVSEVTEAVPLQLMCRSSAMRPARQHVEVPEPVLHRRGGAADREVAVERRLARVQLHVVGQRRGRRRGVGVDERVPVGLDGARRQAGEGDVVAAVERGAVGLEVARDADRPDRVDRTVEVDGGRRGARVADGERAAHVEVGAAEVDGAGDGQVARDVQPAQGDGASPRAVAVDGQVAAPDQARGVGCRRSWTTCSRACCARWCSSW